MKETEMVSNVSLFKNRNSFKLFGKWLVMGPCLI